MLQAKITTHVRKLASTASVIDIGGDVNEMAENALMEAYKQASGNGTKAIILNFSNLEYMNSLGIGLLVTLLIRAQRSNQKLLAYGLSDHYKQIFELTSLDEAIGIYGSEAEAWGDVG
jgi:anti-sigma B factor antagonist